MRVINALIGADVEMFLQDKVSGEVVSAEGLIKGTKDSPFVFDQSSPFFATSLDNVLAEISMPPAKTLEEFVKNLYKSIDYVRRTIPPNLQTLHIASAKLHERFLRTKNAKTFGCSMDYNAWIRDANPPPSSKTNLRSAGLHVHFGYQNPSMETNEDIVKAFDLFCTVPSLLIDEDTERRKLYGKAGAFRPKPYGLEVRTLSAYFANSEELVRWVYNGALKAIEFVNNYEDISEELGNSIQIAINNNDKQLAEKIVKEYKIILP